jgi:hypothetical protein
VAGTALSGTAVAGTSVAAGASVVAGAPQDESSMDVNTSRLTKDPSTDFLSISHLPFNLEYGFDRMVRIYFFELRRSQPS